MTSIKKEVEAIKYPNSFAQLNQRTIKSPYEPSKYITEKIDLNTQLRDSSAYYSENAQKLTNINAQNSTKTEMPLVANITRENIDFSRIAKNTDAALNGQFFDKAQINQAYWGDNGQLSYKILENGAVEIYENDILMGYTDRNGLMNATKVEEIKNTAVKVEDTKNATVKIENQNDIDKTTIQAVQTPSTKKTTTPVANGQLASTLYYETSRGKLCYGVYVPSNYDPTKKTALVMSIPGDGENKCYNAPDGAQCTPKPFTVWTETDNVIVCAIQPGGVDVQKDYQQLIEMTEFMKKEYNIDDSRVYLSATSKGGYAASMALSSNPDIWAGYLQVASSMDRYGAPEACAKNNIYTHIVIGENDEIFTGSIKGNETLLRNAYGDKYDDYVTYDVIEDKTHRNISACVTTDMVYDMLSHSKNDN